MSGSALSFSGSGQYVSATRSAVATNRSFTVAAWVYLTSKGTNHSVVTQDGNSVSDFFLMYDNVIDRFAFADSGTALERELSSYNSASDLDDLHAILDRYNDQETVQIRRILAAQRIR